MKFEITLKFANKKSVTKHLDALCKLPLKEETLQKHARMGVNDGLHIGYWVQTADNGDPKPDIQAIAGSAAAMRATCGILCDPEVDCEVVTGEQSVKLFKNSFDSQLIKLADDIYSISGNLRSIVEQVKDRVRTKKERENPTTRIFKTVDGNEYTVSLTSRCVKSNKDSMWHEYYDTTPITIGKPVYFKLANFEAVTQNVSEIIK